VLAYVFWHWPRPDVQRPDYEQRQRRFHAALRDAPSPGFLGSRSYAVNGATWTGGGGDAYEDWYLVENSAALDPLNEAAVTASRQAPHDAAAAGAAGGTAGLYRLRRGDVDSAAPLAAGWFGKPAGMSYAELDVALEPVVRGSGGVLWMRQMVLGPTPEFCLQCPQSVRLPAGFEAMWVTLRSVWPA
jgi:hypothetical protein